MKSIKIYLSILLSIFFLASCEKDIVFNGEITAPQVVVNSFITPDSIVSAHISESRFFLKDSVMFKNVLNANVAVWVNGVYKETMIHVQNGTYKGTYKPAVGETIKLMVKVPSKNDASCEAKIESQPVVLSIDTTDIWTGQRYEIQNEGYSSNGGPTIYTYDTIATVTGHQINYILKFKDDANLRNYYRLVVQTKGHYLSIDTLTNDTTTSIQDSYFFYFTDVVSGNNSNNDPVSSLIGNPSYNEYNVFSDDLFNGKTYSLTFTTNEDVYKYKTSYTYGRTAPSKKEISVYLQSISRDYYFYLKSRPAASSGSGFFSEAVQIQNNIVGGIGILGSYTSSNVVKIEL